MRQNQQLGLCVCVGGMQSSPLNISDSLLSDRDSDSDSTDRERLCDMSVFN